VWTDSTIGMTNLNNVSDSSNPSVTFTSAQHGATTTNFVCMELKKILTTWTSKAHAFTSMNGQYALVLAASETYIIPELTFTISSAPSAVYKVTYEYTFICENTNSISYEYDYGVEVTPIINATAYPQINREIITTMNGEWASQ
jgi:hypothetical protein